MQRNAKKRPAPGKGRADNANGKKPTSCACAGQLRLAGLGVRHV